MTNTQKVEESKMKKLTYLPQINEIVNIYLAQKGYPLVNETIITRKQKNYPSPIKQIAKHIWEHYQLNLTKDMKQELGNIINRQLTQPQTIHYEANYAIDWRAGDFGDGSSCFWGDRTSAKEMIRDANGFGFCIFNEHQNGIGRAWMIPFKDGFVVFNAYGPYKAEQIAHMYAQAENFKYVHHIRLENNGGSTGQLWINGGSTYFITNSKERPSKIDLELDEIINSNITPCQECGTGLDLEIDDGYFIADSVLCERCYLELVTYCPTCEEDYYTEDTVAIQDAKGQTIHICEGCASDYSTECEDCDNQYLTQRIRLHDYKEVIFPTYIDPDTNEEYEDLCPDCAQKIIETEWERCHNCNKPTEYHYGELCLTCASQLHHNNFTQILQELVETTWKHCHNCNKPTEHRYEELCLMCALQLHHKNLTQSL
jgi:hypothetical protein